MANAEQDPGAERVTTTELLAGHVIGTDGGAIHDRDHGGGVTETTVYSSGDTSWRDSRAASAVESYRMYDEVQEPSSAEAAAWLEHAEQTEKHAASGAASTTGRPQGQERVGLQPASPKPRRVTLDRIFANLFS